MFGAFYFGQGYFGDADVEQPVTPSVIVLAPSAGGGGGGRGRLDWLDVYHEEDNQVVQVVSALLTAL
jgi:hypothetical protein